MSDFSISFSGKTVSVGGQTWQAPWPVKQAVVIGDRVILLYDHMAGPPHHQFRNLEGFSLFGQHVWTAEHPSSETADVYIEIMSTDPLLVWNFACYRCAINPSNGRLIEARFTK
jgi:hypothetical protein